jgi:DNA-binding NtrC family response regulator
VVLTARSGLEALAVAERHEGDIHAVLVDVWMPQLDGPSLVQRLSAMRPGITTLYITGDGSVASWMPSGTVVLEKPLELEGLAAALRELLEEVPHVRATGT